MKSPIQVAVTGAAGQLAYSLIFRIASGEVFGADQPINLSLLEITPAMKALEGVAMELNDCAYPTLTGMTLSDNADTAFNGVNYAVLVGSKPRGPGMERADLLTANGKIFVGQGKSLLKAASDVQVLVVGNPANTNCLIAMRNAGDVATDRFHAMTRLDHNRAISQLAGKAGAENAAVTNVTIWGNHSATQYPDFIHAKIGGKDAAGVINDQAWLEGDFISKVQKRGAEIIAARGVSSAASAANAAIDHLKSMISGSASGDWISSGVLSDGSYGVPEELISSFPITVQPGGKWSVVQGLEINAFAQAKIDASIKELEEEREVVKDLLP